MAPAVALVVDLCSPVIVNPATTRGEDASVGIGGGGGALPAGECGAYQLALLNVEAAQINERARWEGVVRRENVYGGEKEIVEQQPTIHVCIYGGRVGFFIAQPRSTGHFHVVKPGSVECGVERNGGRI